MRIREQKNEYGVVVAVYRCQACGSEFTVTPAPRSDGNWENCLGESCESYDPSRDMDWMFQDDPKVTPIRTPWRSQ